jgi:hypothetical protein
MFCWWTDRRTEWLLHGTRHKRGPNDFQPIFAFLWLSLLEKEPGPSFDLNNLKFPLPKDNLHQVWLKLACSGFGGDFFSIKAYVNTVFLIVAPPDPRGPWFKQTWIYITSKSFHVNMSSSGPVVLEKETFKWPHPIFCIFAIVSPLKRTWPLIWIWTI